MIFIIFICLPENIWVENSFSFVAFHQIISDENLLILVWSIQANKWVCFRWITKQIQMCNCRHNGSNGMYCHFPGTSLAFSIQYCLFENIHGLRLRWSTGSIVETVYILSYRRDSILVHITTWGTEASRFYFYRIFV